MYCTGPRIVQSNSTHWSAEKPGLIQSSAICIDNNSLLSSLQPVFVDLTITLQFRKHEQTAYRISSDKYSTDGSDRSSARKADVLQHTRRYRFILGWPGVEILAPSQLFGIQTQVTAVGTLARVTVLLCTVD